MGHIQSKHVRFTIFLLQSIIKIIANYLAFKRKCEGTDIAVPVLSNECIIDVIRTFILILKLEITYVRIGFDHHLSHMIRKLFFVN